MVEFAADAICNFWFYHSEIAHPITSLWVIDAITSGSFGVSF